MSPQPRLADRAVTLGVTGGIAAYKAAEIVRLLRRIGVRVQVVMTRAATRLMSADTLATLSDQPVVTDMFAGGSGTPGAESGTTAIEHIRLSREVDLLLVAPATANILGKVAHGIADDLLSTTIMASSAPVVFAPAMNVRMWENPILQANLATLRQHGYHFVDPVAGELACGEAGIGRMADPETIVDAAVRLLLQQASGLRILVTAGPTEEPVDPVRVLSNRSSGVMGTAIAAAARDRGHAVTLIAGPLRCPPPIGVECVAVSTAAEMRAAVEVREVRADILIMAAAVSDYRPRMPAASKIPSGSESLTLELVPNVDILASVGPRRRARDAITIGFALEVGESGLERARSKLAAKGVDMMVHNDATRADSAFGGGTTQVTFLFRDGREERLPTGPKTDAAARIVRHAEALYAERRGAPGDA